MFKILFSLVTLTTMISMGVVGKMGNIQPTPEKPAAMLIDADGAISFPSRSPRPETVYELRRAIQTENVEKLNALLVANNLFVAPK